MYTLNQLSAICNGQLFSSQPEQVVSVFITDSRKKALPNSLFVAIKGQRFNGHNFLPIDHSIPCLVSDPSVIHNKQSFILVEDTVIAFQKIATHHRDQFSLPVIGITGSYAKTIIKEWLFQLLSPKFYIVKSPKSYNSQIGVPLSVLQINQAHQLGIFEAGISQPNEMSQLGELIKPQLGIMTNIGNAHAEGFMSSDQKLKEKLLFFSTCSTIVCQRGAISDEVRIAYPTKKMIIWEIENNTIKVGDKTVDLPANNSPYFKKNIGHCVATMLHFGISISEIEKRIQQVEGLPMRVEVANGQHNTLLLNDSYSNDLSGLKICLEYAGKIAPNRPKGLVLGSFQESGLSQADLYKKIAETIQYQKVDFLCFIGSFYQKNKENFKFLSKKMIFVENYQEAIRTVAWEQMANHILIIKGARIDKLDQLVSYLREKSHQTVWEINLSNMIDNLNYYKSLLHPKTKLLVMVKASAYGTEADKIAQTLQDHRVDYLGVAYVDEGISLRKHAIDLPILVMNCAAAQFKQAYDNRLEIQIYSLHQLKQLLFFCKINKIENFPVHIKLETGMNRLGFQKEEVGELKNILQKNHQLISVKGVLSHLSSAGQPNQSQFTHQQIDQFNTMVEQLNIRESESVIKHVLNSSGLVEKSLPQFDMVRLGIGLHGISSNSKTQQKINQVGKLIATISQIKAIKHGESVGYSRAFIADQNMRIATISIGYADGYDRRLGNGIGEVILHGKRAKTVGSICMDMTMIDVTHIKEAKPGDEVVLTSAELPISELANKIGTIPYELLTSIASRVQRRFIYE